MGWIVAAGVACFALAVAGLRALVWSFQEIARVGA